MIIIRFFLTIDNWSQIVNCQCCQPTEYKPLIVELICEDNKKFKKQVTVPVSCTCSTCMSNEKIYNRRKDGIKG